MKTLQINFSDKEISVIELMAPGKTAEEIINTVLRDWFTANSERMYSEVKSPVTKLDEIITAHSKGKGKGVV